MENILNFTETENKIRKKWLFWSTKLPAFVLGCFFAMAAAFGIYTASLEVIIGLCIMSLCVGGGFYLNYYCAYKNPGTILLLLTIIGILLNLPITLLQNVALMKVSLGVSSFWLILVLYELLVLYYSFRLRKINKSMKKRRLTASPAYVNALSVFSTAANLEELDEQFANLRPSHDATTIEALSNAYHQRKKMLEAASSGN